MALTQDELNQIKQSLKDAESALKEAEYEINRARLAGIDVTDQQKQVEDLKVKIRQLKSVYGKAQN